MDEDARTLSLSLRCGEQVITSQITGKTTTEAWNKFVAGSADNVLLDFSYAGYKHGEEEAPDGFSLGYQVVNVRDRMVQKNMTARNALLDIMAEYKLDKGVKEAKVVIYFQKDGMSCIMRRTIRMILIRRILIRMEREIIPVMRF